MNKNHKYNRWGWRLSRDSYVRIVYWRTRAYIAEACLKILFNKKSRSLVEHLHNLENKCGSQAEEITKMRLVAEERNKERKALNILVACDGNCNRDYMDDPESVDEDVVRNVVWNALRLLHWWRRGGKAGADEYLQRVREDIRYKPDGEQNDKKNNS